MLLENFYGKGGTGEVGERIRYGKKRVEGGSSKNGGRERMEGEFHTPISRQNMKGRSEE